MPHHETTHLFQEVLTPYNEPSYTIQLRVSLMWLTLPKPLLINEYHAHLAEQVYESKYTLTEQPEGLMYFASYVQESNKLKCARISRVELSTDGLNSCVKAFVC